MNKKNKHPEFIKYQEFIVSHTNFNNFPYERKKDGNIKWVATGKSKMGQKRTKWCDDKRKQFKINKNNGWLSTIALKNHPLKKKPCSVCGRIMSLEYVYLNNFVCKKLNSIEELPNYYNKLSDIRDVIPEVIDYLGKDGYKLLAKIFKIPNKISEDINNYVNYIISNAPNNKKCGPGAMSNAPDRLDGFHTYNRCCRSKEDTGRHKENLRRYGSDRRAYEHWADGNWKAADRLMKVYNKHNISADHIGPISLGFCHSPYGFQPMTISQQATKNNRMSYDDIIKLIALEKQGYTIISWHSKYIWNELKHFVRCDLDAKILSTYMRKNMHFILSTFALIQLKGFDDFLLYLIKPNLNYSYYDYRFIEFNPKDGSYKKMTKKSLNNKNQKNNAERYIRIAFESLEDYIDKNNRKINDINIFEPVEAIINESIAEIRKNNYSKAKKILEEAFYKKSLFFKPHYLKEIRNRNY